MSCRALVCAGGLIVISLFAGCTDRKSAPAVRVADLQLVRVSFPARQSLAKQATLVVSLRNGGRAAIRSVDVTVATEPRTAAGSEVAFGQRLANGNQLADAVRSIWLLDFGPSGATTAANTTWSTGPLFAGASRTLRWRLTPIVAGTYKLRYSISAASDAKVVVKHPRQSGVLQVRVNSSPGQTTVADDGSVIGSRSDTSAEF